MILGVPVTGAMMLTGGVVLLVLTAFEVLLGMRFIKLGKRNTVSCTAGPPCPSSGWLRYTGCWA